MPINYIVYGLVFLAVVLLMEGAFFLYSDMYGRERAINRRLQLLSDGKQSKDILLELKRERRFGGSGLGAILGWYEELIIQSGIATTVAQFTIMAMIVGLSIGGILLAFTRNIFVSLPAALAAMALPVLFLVFKRMRRHRKFAEMLPDAIDVIVRSLRAGHPVPMAFSLVSEQMKDPIGTEFGIAVDEMTYGLDLDQAMANMVDRVGLPDLQFLAVSVSIQSHVGGNLAEVLGNLSYIIRERFRMRLKIKALSAEGRFTATLLAALPPGVFIIVNIIQPKYYGLVIDDPIFFNVLGVGLAFFALGMFTIFKMIKIRI